MTGLPSGVTGAFEPATIGDGETTLTVSAAANATRGDATITVAASADGAAYSATATLTVTDAVPISVTGRVVSSAGYILPGVALKVWSAGAATAIDVTTDAAGSFTVPAVTPPYDVTMLEIEPEGGDFFNTDYYMGLTSAEPVIAAQRGAGTSLPRRMIAEASFPSAAATTKTNVALDGQYNSAGAALDGNAPPVTLSLAAPVDAPSLDATYRALQFTFTDGVLDYLGYLEQQVTLTTTATALPTTLAPIASRQIAVRARTASGVLPSIVNLWWNVPGGFFIDQREPTSDTFSLRVPSDPRISTRIDFNMTTNSFVRRFVNDTIASLEVTLPETLAITSPSTFDNVTDATVFAVAPSSECTYRFFFNGPRGRTIVVSEAPSVSASDLRARGLGFESGAQYGFGSQCLFAPGTTPMSQERLTALTSSKVDGSGFRGSAVNSFTAH